MRKIVIYIILTVAAAAATSCIYPFEPELDRSAGRNLVIEGDLLVGSYSRVKLSYMSYLDEDISEWAVRAAVWAENERGDRFEGMNEGSNTYYVSLYGADPSSRYRLCVRLDDGREYASEWAEARKAPVVDDITFEPNTDSTLVMFNISLHSDDGEQYFRWSFDEDWEYHSLYRATHKYVYVTEDDPMFEFSPYGYMVQYGSREGTYYCWKHESSHDLMFTTTRELSTNTVTERNFYRVPASSNKMSILYAITVTAESLSEDCYDYWKNVRTNSENLGDLFAPIPSEMRGNIYNVADSTELVLGFINVSATSQKRIFVDNTVTGFYNERIFVPEEDLPIPLPYGEDWVRYYLYKKFLPVGKGEAESFYWAPARCIDCRMAGGTKNRPTFWPNDHY